MGNTFPDRKSFAIWIIGLLILCVICFFTQSSIDMGILTLFPHLTHESIVLINWGIGISIGFGYTQIFLSFIKKAMDTPDLPLNQWVQINENTRVMRHEDGTTSFESMLSEEHPSAT